MSTCTGWSPTVRELQLFIFWLRPANTTIFWGQPTKIPKLAEVNRMVPPVSFGLQLEEALWLHVENLPVLWNLNSTLSGCEREQIYATKGYFKNHDGFKSKVLFSLPKPFWESLLKPQVTIWDAVVKDFRDTRQYTAALITSKLTLFCFQMHFLHFQQDIMRPWSLQPLWMEHSQTQVDLWSQGNKE